jgi:peptide/nickel transport system permease protein
MNRLIIRRLGIGVVLVLVASAVTFMLIALVPGNAAQAILGDSATPAQVAQLTRQLGLDQPLWAQYASWLGHALRGDLGTSLITPQPVTAILNADLSVTLPLTIGAVLTSLVVGAALGTLAAVRGGAIARLIDLAAMAGLALPSFWIGLVLMELVAVKLRWLPATGFVALGVSPLGWLRSLILPVATLAAGGVAAVARQTRDGVDDVLRQEFVIALRADGIPARRVLVRHTLRNAAIPVIAVSGTQFVAALGGAVVIENVFALPGLGSTVVQAATDHDLPLIMGAAVYFCVLVVLASLLVDIAFSLVNPKVRVT